MIMDHQECCGVLNGSIAQGARIGLTDLRAKYPHFNGWMERLEV